MPPPSSNLKLTEYEIRLIGKWIEQGAQYQKHWAFIPPAEIIVPENGDDWARSPIDNFIYQKLDERGVRVPAVLTTSQSEKVNFRRLTEYVRSSSLQLHKEQD